MKSFADECLDRANRATKGPWTPCLGSGNIECTALHFEGNDKYPYGLFVCDLVPDYILDKKYEDDLKFKESNMEFIAHARTDLPEACRRLKKACEVLRHGISTMKFAYRETKEALIKLVDELEAPLGEK